MRRREIDPHRRGQRHVVGRCVDRSEPSPGSARSVRQSGGDTHLSGVHRGRRRDPGEPRGARREVRRSPESFRGSGRVAPASPQSAGPVLPPGAGIVGRRPVPQRRADRARRARRVVRPASGQSLFPARSVEHGHCRLGWARQHAGLGSRSCARAGRERPARHRSGDRGAVPGRAETRRRAHPNGVRGQLADSRRRPGGGSSRPAGRTSHRDRSEMRRRAGDRRL